jgi:hypothetical protein
MGENSFKIDEKVELDPGFKRVANYLLSTDVRRHNRYCPCCKQYEEGKQLSAIQMSEFLEYIRQLHKKLTGMTKDLNKLA